MAKQKTLDAQMGFGRVPKGLRSRWVKSVVGPDGFWKGPNMNAIGMGQGRCWPRWAQQGTRKEMVKKGITLDRRSQFSRKLSKRKFLILSELLRMTNPPSFRRWSQPVHPEGLGKGLVKLFSRGGTYPHRLG